jgi:ethanolaminephosphotransferase
LIKDSKAVPFIGLATAPTVTMSRVKALTTGSAPNFLDIVLNLDAGSSAQDRLDHWLRRLQIHRNFTIDFYGDDTWLKLFPNTFTNYEGTSSFIVTVCWRV